jgi:glycosyltransferase involved in cell wall biosynthesis
MQNNKIFIQIASYRDPQLLLTVEDCINNASHPKNLVFCIAHQFSNDDGFSTDIDKYRNDPRFKIIDIPHNEAKGACWARNKIQQLYDGEKYTFQLDSHHRFTKGWDKELINMIKNLQSKGHKKPLLTSYISSFNPDNDPEERGKEPWWMTFDRFIPEGAIFFLPATIPNFETLTEPIPSRFYSAHFCFTLGQFAKEVQHDPNMYFHGEEISIAVRAFTHGYDLFHPHKVIAWHEYTRNGRVKHWDDDPGWGERNINSHARNRALFGMDGECSPCMRDSLGQYWFGTERTLQDYEEYAGISFKKRATQQYTLDNKFAPNPVINDPVEYDNSFSRIFKHCIDIQYSQVPETDYDFWVVAFENSKGETIFREDITTTGIDAMKNDPDNYYKVWKTFPTTDQPVKWIIWPYSSSKGWCDKIEGNL